MTSHATLKYLAVAGFLGVAAASPAQAESPIAGTQVPVPTYGQHLIDEQADKHPKVDRLALHVVPPGRKDNTIVASNFGRIGKKADQDDYDTIAAGVTHIDLDAPKNRISIYPMLLDIDGHKIGSLGVVFAWKNGDDKEALKREAERIRDDLRRRILNIDNLFEPWPFDVSSATDIVAQKLVDQALDKHPEVQILEIHASPPSSSQSVIIASNIGRHGKPDGAPVLQVRESGEGSSNVVPLHDAAGTTIGTLAITLMRKAGEDGARMQQRTRDIESEIARQIPSQAKLFETAKK